MVNHSITHTPHHAAPRHAAPHRAHAVILPFQSEFFNHVWRFKIPTLLWNSTKLLLVYEHGLLMKWMQMGSTRRYEDRIPLQYMVISYEWYDAGWYSTFFWYRASIFSMDWLCGTVLWWRRADYLVSYGVMVYKTTEECKGNEEASSRIYLRAKKEWSVTIHIFLSRSL